MEKNTKTEKTKFRPSEAEKIDQRPISIEIYPPAETANLNLQSISTFHNQFKHEHECHTNVELANSHMEPVNVYFNQGKP